MWRCIKPHLCRIGASPLIGWKFAPSTSRLKSLRLLAIWAATGCEAGQIAKVT